MTYEKAVNALVAAGLLGKANVASAVAVLDSTAVELTYPDWAAILAKTGLIPKSEVGAAADVMEKAGDDEAKDDPAAFEKGLEDAGIF